MKKQHTQPCKECPFRRVSPAGYLGDNQPQIFSFLASRDGHFPCHLTMGKKSPERECAGRAIMWANQCKKARDGSVPNLEKDRESVFANILEFNAHHKIVMTQEEMLFGPEEIADEQDEGALA